MPSEAVVRRALEPWKYVYRFGARSGTIAYLKSRRGKGTARIELPGYPGPIELRRGSSDVSVFDEVFISREYDLDIDPGPAPLIIDAGANVGYASVFLAREYPAARILAIEPDRANFDLLHRNTRFYEGVRAIHGALWCESGQVRIEDQMAEPWALRVVPAKDDDPLAVPAVTIPELLRAEDRDRIDLLKIDIEGSERELFSAGYESWLGLVETMVIELHDWARPGASKSVFAAVSRFDFAQSIAGEKLVFSKVQSEGV